MNKQQLASKIWESANKMRSKIEANEYKDYILGFMFYKFLSDKEVKWLKENDWTDEYLPDLTEEDAETVDTVRKNVGYFIEEFLSCQIYIRDVTKYSRRWAFPTRTITPFLVNILTNYCRSFLIRQFPSPPQFVSCPLY